ncbi:MAG: hypothetical protein J5950_01820 [Clostridia bacterium]|nr:hypothetical protein [Clostridia bacterium]
MKGNTLMKQNKKGFGFFAALAAISTAICILLSGIAVMADVPADDVARIETHGYDLSAFTVIDDTDESVVINNLAETAAAVHLCGQAHFTGAVGSMTLTFEGNAVGVIVEKGGYEIFIDDESMGMFWASAIGAPQVMYYTGTLTNDTHTITVTTNPEFATEKIGENYSVLEGFFVQTTPGTGSAADDPGFDPAKQDIAAEERAKINAGNYDLTDFRIVDDCAPNVLAQGLSVTEHESHLNGNANFTAGTGSLSYTFEGTAVGVLVEKGGFEVEIDGTVIGRCGAATIGAPQVVFYTGDLSNGTHTIKVTTVPDVSNEYTGEPWSVIEGFFVQKEPGVGSADGASQQPETTEQPTEQPTE